MLARSIRRLRFAPLRAAVICLLAALPALAAAETVTYDKVTKKVKGLEMTIFSKPTDDGGALRITTSGKFLWFSQHGTPTSKIVKFETTGKAKFFTVPSANASVLAITRGPDGNVWFPVFNQGLVGYIRPNGKFKLFSTGTSDTSSNDIITGPDDNLWFGTDFGLGRTTPGGDTAFFPLVTNSDNATGVTVGSDDKIWFVEWGASSGSAKPGVGRMKTNGGGVKEFKVGFGDFSNSYGIASGPDGRIWFCDPQRRRIGRMKVNGDGLVYYSAGLTGDPISIIAGPDGNLWFGEIQSRIGRITPAGVITEFDIPDAAGTTNFPVLGLTVGPDGNIWFVNNSHAELGRLAL